MNGHENPFAAPLERGQNPFAAPPVTEQNPFAGNVFRIQRSKFDRNPFAVSPEVKVTNPFPEVKVDDIEMKEPWSAQPGGNFFSNFQARRRPVVRGRRRRS